MILKLIVAQTQKTFNWYGENSINGVSYKSRLVWIDNREILSTNNNSLYNIRNRTIKEFDEIFISRGQQEKYLYTQKSKLKNLEKFSRFF